MKPPVYIFTAYSNTGKTTYLERLISCLKEAGLRTAVIKHDAHDRIQLDTKGKDSWRFMEAGADVTAVVSQSRLAVFERRSASLEELTASFRDVDIVLVEGFRESPYPKIALFRTETGKPYPADLNTCFAVVADMPVDAPCSVFPLEDAAPLAAYLVHAAGKAADTQEDHNEHFPSGRG